MILPFIGGLLVGFILSGGIGFALFIYWIAAGEPDVNGDPERDAGREP